MTIYDSFEQSRFEIDNEAPEVPSRFFMISKRAFDLFMCFLLLPTMVAIMLILLVLNPLFNKGPVFYAQIRMGKDCRAFRAYKFRSMLPAGEGARSAEDGIEEDRITPLGKWMRKSRCDELPQIFNVIKGEMSMIGPRPDSFSHARQFLRTIPEYRQRHSVRPGISGLAQVSLGYAVGTEATRAKALMDQKYIRTAGFKTDTKLVFQTIQTVLARAGA